MPSHEQNMIEATHRMQIASADVSAMAAQLLVALQNQNGRRAPVCAGGGAYNTQIASPSFAPQGLHAAGMAQRFSAPLGLSGSTTQWQAWTPQPAPPTSVPGMPMPGLLFSHEDFEPAAKPMMMMGGSVRSHTSAGYCSDEGSSGQLRSMTFDPAPGFKHAPANKACAAKPTSQKTTLMIRNVPSKYTQTELMEEWPNRGTYDYLYLPRGGERNLSYAFVNFVSPAHANAFFVQWHKQWLPRYSAMEPLDIGYAEIQGLEANLHDLVKKRQRSRRMRIRGCEPVIVIEGKQVLYKEVLSILCEGGSVSDLAKVARGRGGLSLQGHVAPLAPLTPGLVSLSV